MELQESSVPHSVTALSKYHSVIHQVMMDPVRPIITPTGSAIWYMGERY